MRAQAAAVAALRRLIDSLRRTAVFAEVERARLRHPAVATNAAGKLAQPRIEVVDVALAPARDLAVGADAKLIQHAFDDRADADDHFQVVRRAGRIEERRRRIGLDIDDDLSITGNFGAGVGNLRQQSAAIVGERAKLRELCAW